MWVDGFTDLFEADTLKADLVCEIRNSVQQLMIAE